MMRCVEWCVIFDVSGARIWRRRRATRHSSELHWGKISSTPYLHQPQKGDLRLLRHVATLLLDKWKIMSVREDKTMLSANVYQKYVEKQL